MVKGLLVVVGIMSGGSVGWWIGAHVNIMTAFLTAVCGMAAGSFVTRRWVTEHLP